MTSVAELFTQEASDHPRRAAIRDGRRIVTYGAVNGAAERASQTLSRLGVGSETPVGICLDRSSEFISTVLAVWKAGGTCVPLDPGYPTDRLEYMVKDAGIAIMITASGSNQPPIFSGDVVTIKELLRPGERLIMPRRRPDVRTGGSLAYIYYTSGSTGTPKGVQITDGAILNLIRGLSGLNLSASTRCLHGSATMFDLSTFEVWGPLLHGGQVVVSRQRTPTLADLRRTIEEGAVNTLWLTSSLFNLVVERSPDTLQDVRTLIVGGEPVSVEHMRRALKILTSTTIFNGYGPTEATTLATTFRITEAEENASSIPIGRPIGGTATYVLDRHLRHVPVGVFGELYIAGAGLARGYVGRPGLTASSFLPNPYSHTGGERMYRTGDIARFRSDGNLEFSGRLDGQVKVRGFRIELGEITTRIRQHPSVSDAAVAVLDGLVAAFVVLRAGEPPSVPDLERFCASFLPRYMVPSSFTYLDELPVNSNGKLDQRALREMRLGLAVRTSSSGRRPKSATEKRIAAIWKRILHQDTIGTDDDFFALGGHSLLALEVLADINVDLGVELAVRSLFDAPTIATLAKIVEYERAQRSGGSPHPDDI